jgi:thiamine biosynthesis protein ThiS
VPTDSICVHINGEPRQVPSSQSIRGLLEWLEVPSDRVAIELDAAIVRKRDWDKIIVGEGCVVEIVQFVGGG